VQRANGYRSIIVNAWRTKVLGRAVLDILIDAFLAAQLGYNIPASRNPAMAIPTFYSAEYCRVSPAKYPEPSSLLPPNSVPLSTSSLLLRG
jgi:hypothetical protein